MIRRFATIAAVLGLVAGTASAAPVYTDVPASHWAAMAVSWASGQGIMTGPGNRPGFFDPAGLTNRAELATALWRHDLMLQKQLSDLQVRITLLENGSSVSSFSRSSASSARTRALSAVLSGNQEVPSVSIIGTGYGTFQLDGDDLTYDISVDKLTSAITGAHFHRGAAGVAGPVVEPITFSGERATGTWFNLTQTEIDDLLAGRFYVNVHTSSHSDGEIRGQVTLGTASVSSSRSSVSSSRSSSLSSSSLSSLSSSASSASSVSSLSSSL